MLIKIYELNSLTKNEKYAKTYDDKYFVNYKGYKIYEALYTAFDVLLIYFIPLLTLFVGLLLAKFTLISLGVILSLYTLSSNLRSPINSLSILLSLSKQNKANLEIVDDIYNINSSNLLNVNDFNKIEFSSKGITFSNNTILNNVKIEISKGDFISLCGSSGSGKSTVLKLLTKELDNENVNITVDNEDIRELNLTGLLLIVTQQSYMFSDTIKNNICCGDMYKEDELREIYKLTLLEEFIGKYGEDKIIDFSDSNISGGEKQRIALARILIRKPKLLLLDEITSSLDDTNSHLLAKNIYEYAKSNNITVVVISHKDEFLEYSNKVIKIN